MADASVCGNDAGGAVEAFSAAPPRRATENRATPAAARPRTGGGFGRFAPSPTGDFHLGNLRTALLAWSFARRSDLGFLMRMEDLDARSRPEHAVRQLEDLEALGIDWDGEVIWQSRLGARYEAAFARLDEAGLLYECYCTRRELAQVASAPHMPPGSYAGTCRNLSEAEREAGRAKLAGMARGPAMRLRAGVKAGVVHDTVCGRYAGTVDDIVIRRGDGVWSYNFVSVLDDALDGVVQVVRGNDLLASAPRQASVARLQGFEVPEYVHVPMVFNMAGVRLAKRDGAVTMRALAEFGWTPADIIQLIGSSLGMAEVRSAEEFARQLRLEALAWPAGMDADRLADAPGTWLLDPVVLEAGPRALLGRN